MEFSQQFEVKVTSLAKDLWEIRNDAVRNSLDYQSILLTLGLTNEILDSFRVLENNYLLTSSLNEREGILVALVVVLADQIMETCSLRWKLPSVRSNYLSQFLVLTNLGRDLPSSYKICEFNSRSQNQNLNLVDYKVSKTRPMNDKVWNESDSEGQLPLARHPEVPKITSSVSDSEPARNKRKRTSFTTETLSLLNDAYRTSKFLTGSSLDELERNSGASKKQIRDWFANKRKREK